jgi:ParB/RepB/Spo0J family partition protein
MRDLIKQISPSTKLAKLTLANWKAVKRAGLASAMDGAEIVRIPLEQLDDSPFQLRHDIDQDELDELTRSIKEHGLLNPILIRPLEKDYEIISGHRRVAAYRRLSFAANTDAEHKKWDTIPARVLPSVSDDQVLLLGMAENMFRADISPMDAAQGLVTLEKLKPELKSAPKIAAATGLQEKKVERLLRLADSPEVVQKAVQDGIEVPDEPAPKNDSPDDDSSSEQKRTLDLFSALEFTRLYQAISKKGDNAKNGKKMADSRTGAAIARALNDRGPTRVAA